MQKVEGSSPFIRFSKSACNATMIRDVGLVASGWLALAALVAGLIAAAILLAPWDLKFAVDAQQLYDELYEQAANEANDGTLGWLAAAGYGYQALREENSGKVRWMSRVSGALGVLMIVQTLAWLAALGVDQNREPEAAAAKRDQAAVDIDRHR
jgi:hypothetical protein